jgi:hypothetical protein
MGAGLCSGLTGTPGFWHLRQIVALCGRPIRGIAIRRGLGWYRAVALWYRRKSDYTRSSVAISSGHRKLHDGATQPGAAELAIPDPEAGLLRRLREPSVSDSRFPVGPRFVLMDLFTRSDQRRCQRFDKPALDAQIVQRQTAGWPLFGCAGERKVRAPRRYGAG